MNADIEFWKMPSRRFYVAKLSDFEELRKSVQRKKLKLKKPVVGQFRESDGAGISANSANQLDKIEETVKKVCNKVHCIL